MDESEADQYTTEISEFTLPEFSVRRILFSMTMGTINSIYIQLRIFQVREFVTDDG